MCVGGACGTRGGVWELRGLVREVSFVKTLKLIKGATQWQLFCLLF
jgi:hypothetical protein